jgi:hypothetical protein
MRIPRLIAPLMLALTFSACSKDEDPTGPGADDLRLEAAAKLQDMSVNMPDANSRAAVKQAGVMLNLGAPITEVELTTAASGSLSRELLAGAPSFEISNGTATWNATAMQVVLQNSSNSGGTYNVFVLWKGDEDLVFAGAPATGTDTLITTTPGNAFGGLFTAPSASWRATGGKVSISRTSLAQTCDVSLNVTGLSCKNAQFTGQFNISNSAPFAVSGTNTASGSRTAALGSRSVAGIQVTVDCSLHGC